MQPDQQQSWQIQQQMMPMFLRMLLKWLRY
jgi:hypothetical protein